MSRISRLEVFCKKGVLQACNFIKKQTLAQVFSCEFCEISKNTFSYRTPPVAASVCHNYLLSTSDVLGDESIFFALTFIFHLVTHSRLYIKCIFSHFSRYYQGACLPRKGESSRDSMEWVLYI